MNYRVMRVGRVPVILAAAAVLAWLVMMLWNAVIPAVFVGGRTVDYWHAVGLLLLSRALFGGFRGHGGWGRRRHWRRWKSMTPEERERFRAGFRARYERGEERT